MQRTVEKLQAALRSLLQQECISSELFPPIEIHDATPTSPSVGRFRVQCGPSQGHALSEVLSIFIRLELLDEHSEAVQITCGGYVSRDTLEWSSLDSATLQELFKGVYNQSSVEERLKQMLYSLLDKAQQVRRQPENGGGALWLSDPARSEVKE